MSVFRRAPSGLHVPGHQRPALTRRGLLAGAGLAAAGTAVSMWSAQAAGAPDSSSIPWETLRSMVGVCLKIKDSQPWTNHAELLDALKTGGFSWVRTDALSGASYAKAALDTYGQGGIKIQAIMGFPTMGPQPADLVDFLVTNNLTQWLIALEGANEWNLREGHEATWVSELLAHQVALYQAAKSTPETRGLPVVAPSMGMLKDWDTWGFHPEILNAENSHCYYGANPPEDKARKAVDLPRASCGYLPVILTETGSHDLMTWSSEHYPTPNDVAAVYDVRSVLIYFLLGVPRLSFYTLADPGTGNDKEDHFGLLTYTLAPKPQFTALANLSKVIARGGLSGSVSSFSRTISGADDVWSVAAKGPNGRVLLFVWRDVSIYDRNTKQHLHPSTKSVHVDFGTNRSVAVFNPVRGSSQIDEHHGSSITLGLAGEALCLDIS